jgi:hypothetical protein
MVSLLEKIARNTGTKVSPSRSETTIINNNTTTSAGYGSGNSSSNDNQKTNTQTIVRDNSKINNNHVDKFRKIHDLVAKSPRA